MREAEAWVSSFEFGAVELKCRWAYLVYSNGSNGRVPKLRLAVLAVMFLTLGNLRAVR